MSGRSGPTWRRCDGLLARGTPALQHRREVRERIVVAARPGVEFVIGLVVLALGVPVWSGYSHEIGIGLIVAGGIAIAHGAITFVLEERRRRLETEAEEARGRAEMRRIADLARELLLETAIWTDVDELASRMQAQQFSGQQIRPPREWSVGAVVGRGREDLDPGAVRGWSTMAQLLRDHASRLTSAIDQEFPGQPAERRSSLRTVFQAVEAAAKGAEDLAARRQRVAETPWGTPEERRAADDALCAAADTFFGACQWLEGVVMNIEPDAELLEAMAGSRARHRQMAEEAAAARRELQAIAARTAGALLNDAAPAPEYLTRSTLCRGGTLHDVAADERFAFAPADEAAALRDWRVRIDSGERRFAAAVQNRGWDMSITTHWLWVQVNGDGIRELVNAVQRLEEDLARTGLAGAADDVVEGSRERLRGAVHQLVEKIARLQAHEAR